MVSEERRHEVPFKNFKTSEYHAPVDNDNKREPSSTISAYHASIAYADKRFTILDLLKHHAIILINGKRPPPPEARKFW